MRSMKILISLGSTNSGCTAMIHGILTAQTFGISLKGLFIDCGYQQEMMTLSGEPTALEGTFVEIPSLSWSTQCGSMLVHPDMGTMSVVFISNCVFRTFESLFDEGVFVSW